MGSFSATPRKGKIKTPLQMMGLVEKNEVFSVPETRAIKTGPEDNCAPLLSATKSLNKNNSVEKVTTLDLYNKFKSENYMDIF